MPSVVYRPLEQVMDDCNKLSYNATAFEYWQVPRSALNKPVDEDGVIILIPTTAKGGDYGQGSYLIQLFYSRSGLAYSRTVTYVSGQLRWGQWRSVAGGGSSQSGAILRPENESQISDANVLNYSGIFRTTNTTQNLPQGVDNPWGVLQHFYENNGSDNPDAKAGFQLYAPITGAGFGNLYIRVFNAEHRLEGNTTWKRLNISKLIDLQDKVITEPTETLTEVNGTHETGYYYTASNATGMEGIPQDKKDGILKVIKDEAGNVSIQEFTSSVAGDNDVYVRTLPISSPMARQGQTPFQLLGGSATKIISQERDIAIPNPNEYVQNNPNSDKQTNGYVMYEWKFTGADGTQLPQEEEGKRDVLVTYQPYPSNGHNLNNDFSDITQVAYIDDGRIFVRHGQKQSNDWDAWKEIGNGTGLELKTVEDHYVSLFNKWAETATE